MTAHHSPLHQFAVHPIEAFHIKGIDISYTNASAWMTIVFLAITLFFTFGMRRRALVPNRWQSLVEISYGFIATMMKDTVGVQGRKYFPFVFSLFLFILTCNLMGMLPYSFTVTSHVIVTFALAVTVFIGVTIIGFVQHGLGYLKMFLPSGAPLALAPLMIVIEMISYLSRPVSLAIRLVANMMAGHIMLKVLGGFVISMGIFGLLPLAFLIALTGFEIFVAFIQAYIFTILTCVYLNDAIHMNH